MTHAELRSIWQKTEGHCHFCGDQVVFETRGWINGDLTGYWEVDHVIQRHKGGSVEAEKCLPACTRCNRLRWHRKGDGIRELLFLGLIAAMKFATALPSAGYSSSCGSGGCTAIR